MVYKNMERGFGLFRNFNGKKYRRYETSSSKSSANKTARDMKKEGVKSVRVAENNSGYAVYLR